MHCKKKPHEWKTPERPPILVRDAFVKTNRRAIAMVFVHLCLSQTDVHCDHTVHFSIFKFVVG